MIQNPKNGVNYRHNMKDWVDHERLAKRLAASKCKWIVSSYDREEVRNLYQGYNAVAVQSYSGMKTKKNSQERVLNKEVLIANFELPNVSGEILGEVQGGKLYQASLQFGQVI